MIIEEHKDPEVPKFIEYKGIKYEVIFHNMRCFVIPRNTELEDAIEKFYKNKRQD